MSDMLKVIEVLAESNNSWEDAAAQAVRRASKSVHKIKSIYIKDRKAQAGGLGRNAPCPCGRGKKYQHRCGAGF